MSLLWLDSRFEVGYPGVLKVVIAEVHWLICMYYDVFLTFGAQITDSTNVADAFALIPVMWTCGSALGYVFRVFSMSDVNKNVICRPIIGGMLSQPAKRWPNVFHKLIFFHQFPYYLPCLVSAVIALASSLFGFIGLKEVDFTSSPRKVLTHASFRRYHQPLSDERKE